MANLNKKIIIIPLKVLVSSGLLYFVISKTGVEKVVSALGEMNLLLFLVAVLIYLSSIFLCSIRWRLLIHDHFDFRRLFSFYLMGSFFNHILPGIIGGDAVKVYYLYKDTGRGASALASVFMDRYVGFTALMFVGLSAFPFGLSYFKGSYIEWVLPLIILLFVVGSFIIFGLKIGRRIKFLSGFYDYFVMYKGKRDVLAKTFFISLVVQIIIIFGVYFVSLGLKADIPLLAFFMFIPIISTIATVPISIAGLGLREASFVLLFGFLGVSPVQATAISFAWFLSFVAGSIPGLVEYLRYKKMG
ncbi:MAG TPA: lysylphosphatidylglycerol synthase transmembrane domain-containing protein [Thermodesulfovibrionales bacterium]|nr:lysylphosphatidylglycerol synthase transmembrane domain-containing protein [Thermodesulfovibrionales bacterium]